MGSLEGRGGAGWGGAGRSVVGQSGGAGRGVVGQSGGAGRAEMAP